MSERVKFKDEEGELDGICFLTPEGDYTLCGVQADERCIDTKEKANCPRCIEVVEMCKKTRKTEYIDYGN